MATHEADPERITGLALGPASGRENVSPEARRGYNRYLIKLTIISTLGGLLFGYDTGVISGALVFMQTDLHLSSNETTFVVTSLLFGAIIGAAVGGRMADALGRRYSMRIYAVVFFLGAIGSGLSPTIPLMYASRVVLGLAVGAASATVPLYLSEMAPAHRRGRMTTINELMIVSGQFAAYGINSLINTVAPSPHVWRAMLVVAAIPAVALFIGLFFLPDSPRWYAIKGRLGDTKRVLALSRGPAEAAEEFNIVKVHAERDTGEERGAARRDLAAYPWMRRVLYIGIGLALAQQLTGINTVNYYSPTILKDAGFATSAALVGAVAVGATAVIGCIIGIFLLGLFNRRPLLIIGFSGVALSDAVLALSFALPNSKARDYVILAAMLIFVAFVQIFAGPLIWLMLSEIFPMTIRGYCMGIAVVALWGINTVISYVFPTMVSALGSTWTFGVFGVINVGSVLFCVKFAPETRGRTLEELEDDFRSHDAGHFVHEAPAGVYGS
jgi:major inositol transporter-like SP family MFS transporter